MERMLTPQQLHKLEVTERVASCFSLIGTSFILFTFLYSPVFRKPVNRLIFYASWGNTLCNVGGILSTITIVSQNSLSLGSHLDVPVPCKGREGFSFVPIPRLSHPDVRSWSSTVARPELIVPSRFLPADALWNLAMAINVYMKLFRKYSSHQLKALEWKYHIMCYGGPFLVAFVYIFVQTAAHGRIYGPAILWCWIDIDWVVLRIALCYAPAWCCIIISFFIYLLAGREIFIKRQQLRAFSQSRSPVAPIENPFTGYKTTEIHITSELATLHSPEPDMSKFFLGSQDTTQKPTASRSSSIKGYDQYSVTIDSAPLSPRMEMAGVTHGITPGVPTLQQRKNKIAMEANTAAWGYTKVALLFFISLLVTWASLLFLVLLPLFAVSQ